MMTEKKQTRQQILELAIQKAIDGGWQPFGVKTTNVYMADGKLQVGTGKKLFMDDYAVEEFIFNHDFAKALWGEEPHGFDPMQVITNAPPFEWVFQLQCMVIADDPIAYLGENI